MMTRILLLLLLLASTSLAAFRTKSTTKSTTSSSSSSTSTTTSGKNGWEVKGKIGATTTSSTVGMTGGLVIAYHWNQFISWRNDLSVKMADVTDPQVDAFLWPSNLIWHPLGTTKVVSPYVGPGLNLSYKPSATNIGWNFLGGFDFKIAKKTFGIEARYTKSDLTDNSADGTWELALTGAWELDFGS